MVGLVRITKATHERPVDRATFASYTSDKLCSLNLNLVRSDDLGNTETSLSFSRSVHVAQDDNCRFSGSGLIFRSTVNLPILIGIEKQYSSS